MLVSGYLSKCTVPCSLILIFSKLCHVTVFQACQIHCPFCQEYSSPVSPWLVHPINWLKCHSSENGSWGLLCGLHYLLNFMCMDFCLHVCLYSTCVWCSEARRGSQISWHWNYRRLWTAMQALELEPGSLAMSNKCSSLLNHLFSYGTIYISSFSPKAVLPYIKPKVT